jgi:hypothetical protein
MAKDLEISNDSITWEIDFETSQNKNLTEILKTYFARMVLKP